MKKFSDIKNATDFAGLIDINNKTALELGPLDKPKLDFTSPNVKSLDHLTQTELIEKYRSDAKVDVEKITRVDYVWSGEKFSDIISEKFDYVLASHVIEHTPNLVGFFNNVSSILNDDGLLFLIIPDKRYCFDHFKPITNIYEVVHAYITNRTKPSFCNIVEHRRLACHNDPKRHWIGDHGEITPRMEFNDFSVPISQVIKTINYYEQNYIDGHVWKFTPDTFLLIANYLFDQNLIELKLNDILHTQKDTQQFYVIMQLKC
ncbi:MAG: methyltransferase domain-containing protein [Melioribacteraceae bacterium]